MLELELIDSEQQFVLLKLLQQKKIGRCLSTWSVRQSAPLAQSH